MLISSDMLIALKESGFQTLMGINQAGDASLYHQSEWTATFF